MKNFPFPYLGSISHGTLRTEDLLPDFLHVLRKLGGTLSRADANKVRRILDREEWSNEERYWCDELLHEELFNKLGCFAPDYCYFGATEGDGADFGFWLSSDWEERAREDGIPFVLTRGGVVAVVHGRRRILAASSRVAAGEGEIAGARGGVVERAHAGHAALCADR